MKTLRISLKVVFYREDDRWFAHCLEMDLLGDGDTREEALGLLTEAITEQLKVSVENNAPENLFFPAESKYFQMFAAGKDIAVGEMTIQRDSVTVNAIEAREYSSDEDCVLV